LALTIAIRAFGFCTVAPGRRCLECLGAYDPSVVGLEREGLLDDPSYLEQLEADHALLRHENVFPFSTSLAALEVLQLASLLLGLIQNIGDQNYHFVAGTLDREQDKGWDVAANKARAGRLERCEVKNGG
jgi:hypothetical protein